MVSVHKALLFFLFFIFWTSHSFVILFLFKQPHYYYSAPIQPFLESFTTAKQVSGGWVGGGGEDLWETSTSFTGLLSTRFWLSNKMIWSRNICQICGSTFQNFKFVLDFQWAKTLLKKPTINTQTLEWIENKVISFVRTILQAIQRKKM